MSLSATAFLTSVPTVKGLPEDTGHEVVFAGRSNAGKSSAINAIVGAKALARVSKEPGRTQAFNVFAVADGARVVDIPGYGFARVPPRVKARWDREIPQYFMDRESLVEIFLVSDVRRPLQELDQQFLDLARARTTPVAVTVILSKADKFKSGKLAQAVAEARSKGEEFGIAPEDIVPFSAVTGRGRDALKEKLLAALGLA